MQTHSQATCKMPLQGTCTGYTKFVGDSRTGEIWVPKNVSSSLSTVKQTLHVFSIM